MRVVFDHALDGPAWPGPFRDADFTFGEAWVGPMGLLGLLETRLGLRGRVDGLLQRACRLAKILENASGHWRPSFDVDPLATCRRLLRNRDELRMVGWTGQPVSTRLTELHQATTEAAPGVPDRLEAIVKTLAVRGPDLDSVVSYTAIAHLPWLWREVFAGLQRAGVAIEERALPPTAAAGDLAGARTTGFSPVGDGRVCLLRRHGTMDVADEVAASLASSDHDLTGVVIVGADAVLDQALARHGLPRVGANTSPPASSGLLSLVLETAFRPMEMSDLHALLAADPGPIPRPLAAKLIEALQESPGRGTAEWKDAIAEGLARIDEDKREDAQRRVTVLLSPVCDRDQPLPGGTLRERLQVLDGWARSRMAFIPSLFELSQRIQTLLEAVDLMSAGALSWHELRRFCEDLGPSSWTWQAGEAGLRHVKEPGAILGPARAIIWWNFSRETAKRSERLLLTRTERDGLRAAGIEPPDPGLAMAAETQGWRRPLSQAREALILACPFTDAGGEPNHPHPLWDDVMAALADQRDARKLERGTVVRLAPAALIPVPPRSVIAPAQDVTLTSPVDLGDRASPSAIERLIGCSLSWALQYRARLYPGLSTGPLLPPNPILFGNLAHRILAQVLGNESAAADEVAKLAGCLFDQQCADLCEDLALPYHMAARATVRRVVVESARELTRLARKHGATGAKTETEGETTGAGLTIAGRLDLTWEQPPIVLDLKWGKTSQVERLETGTAIQLAAYSAMRSVAGRPAETAYFALLNQDLLAEPGGRLSGDARVVGGFSAAQTWEATLKTLAVRRSALAAGRLEAPGATGEALEPSISASGIELAPPCKYCSFQALCGRGGAR